MGLWNRKSSEMYCKHYWLLTKRVCIATIRNEAYLHYLAGISKVVLENHFIDGPHCTCKICNATSERPWLHCAWYWIDNELVHEFRKSNPLQIPMMMKVSKDTRKLGLIDIPYLDTGFNCKAAHCSVVPSPNFLRSADS